MQRSALRSTTSIRGGARVAVPAMPVRRVAGRRGVAARAEKVSEVGVVVADGQWLDHSG